MSTTASEQLPAATASPVRALRMELGMTLAQLGQHIGLSKSKVHDVEATGRASLRVALAIEDLSGGRIDAAELCDDVKLARHGAASTATANRASTGNFHESAGRSGGGDQ